MIASTLTTAADWAAIAAALFAFLLLVGSIARWLWARWNGTELDHALHTERAPVGFDLHDEGAIGLRVGLNLANGSGVPLSHQVVRFDVRVGDWDNPLTEVVHREEVAPGQTKGWYRDRMTVGAASLPDNVTVTYDIHYGRHGRKLRRHLTGLFTFRMAVSDGPLAASFEEYLVAQRIGTAPGDHRLRQSMSLAVRRKATARAS